jgi:nitrate reductase beta subunit
MAKVYNWQIGREMDYVYEESRPDKQFAMIFDTNKCIACQTCTVVCKTTWTQGPGQETMFWNNVESKPYGFYPLGWDVKILDKLGVRDMDGPVYEGKTIFEAAPDGERMLGYLPEELDYAYPNVGEDDSFGPAIAEAQALMQMPHNQWMFYLARICNHCTYPGCLGSCPRTSIYKRQEDGIVLLDQSRCRGYQECVKGCPYKKVFYNPVTKTSEKCIGCYPAVENGRQTQCTIACIGKIRLMGFLAQPKKIREDNPIDFLVHVKKIAKPLYPQFGLEPNTYYIPPIHVPPQYMKQMFGHGVAEAMELYRNAKDDKQLLGALLLFGATEEIIDTFKVKGDYAYGYNDKGAEVAKVPLVEPMHIRDAYSATRQAHQMNIT